MKRPILKDYPKESTKTISKHQLELTEWSWWAEDRIKELEKQLLLLHSSLKLNANKPLFLDWVFEQGYIRVEAYTYKKWNKLYTSKELIVLYKKAIKDSV